MLGLMTKVFESTQGGSQWRKPLFFFFFFGDHLLSGEILRLKTAKTFFLKINLLWSIQVEEFLFLRWGVSFAGIIKGGASQKV